VQPPWLLLPSRPHPPAPLPPRTAPLHPALVTTLRLLAPRSPAHTSPAHTSQAHAVSPAPRQRPRPRRPPHITHAHILSCPRAHRTSLSSGTVSPSRARSALQQHFRTLSIRLDTTRRLRHIQPSAAQSASPSSSAAPSRDVSRSDIQLFFGAAAHARCPTAPRPAFFDQPRHELRFNTSARLSPCHRRCACSVGSQHASATSQRVAVISSFAGTHLDTPRHWSALSLASRTPGAELAPVTTRCGLQGRQNAVGRLRSHRGHHGFRSPRFLRCARTSAHSVVLTSPPSAPTRPVIGLLALRPCAAPSPASTASRRARASQLVYTDDAPKTIKREDLSLHELLVDEAEPSFSVLARSMYITGLDRLRARYMVQRSIEAHDLLHCT
jgi:hypothetical protein